MTLRLNGSSSGYTEIDAPAAAGSNTLTLPTGNGSANQFIKNGSTAGELEYSSMVEDSSGNVGIGTTSPTSTLTVDGSVNSSDIRFPAVSSGGAANGFLTYDLNSTDNGSAGTGDLIIRRGDGTERMRIRSSGIFNINTTNNNPPVNNLTGSAFRENGTLNIGASSAAVVQVGRTVNDGELVTLYQAGTKEGTISVSGSTVSYNGGHLSRWSQLPSGAERTEILRGSVLSNLDEMCEWGEEDNEQLNRMKVSDVEGDVNVSGVFQAWDDDDDTYTNDFYCAMTGDFVIRIAQGVTVARGDLLMSAGDGTAKPQDDDIVRSKTIAKVTSTVVSETYADGSYCVPCVLMAC